MVRIVDVARHAGVSVATVSRALNGHASVHPHLAERVRLSAGLLGYLPNGVARNLRRQVTDVLALIISDVANPFYTAVARGVEDIAQQNGLSVLLCNADESPDKERRYLEMVRRERVAGVVLSPHSAQTDVSALLTGKVPLVAIDRPLAEPAAAEIDSILVRSAAGAAQATAHLLGQGWMRPACITGPAEATTARQRRDGYLRTVGAQGFDPVVAHAPFRQSGGKAAAAQLLNTDHPPDSFLIGNSQMALGVLEELAARGLRVGRDVGVVSFDDPPWAPFTSPPLTVVAQPAYQIGSMAAELLVARIRGDPSKHPTHVTFPTTLLVRGSSLRTDG